mmetsp:Transcript_63987/g.87917  ORF Transcript_63987/g.87917 Transcript_63987/m.87917 type:complete len:83 (+) Transcript_63987:136-384(+)
MTINVRQPRNLKSRQAAIFIYISRTVRRVHKGNREKGDLRENEMYEAASTAEIKCRRWSEVQQEGRVFSYAMGSSPEPYNQR